MMPYLECLVVNYIFFVHQFQISLLWYLFYWSVSLSLKPKIFSWEIILPKYFEFKQNRIQVGRFSGSQKSYNRKICFALYYHIEKTQQIYLGEKEVDGISAIRKTIPETLGLFIYWYPILGLCLTHNRCHHQFWLVDVLKIVTFT